LAADAGVAQASGALHAAAEHGRLPAVQLWRALGLELDGRDRAGMTALHKAASNGHLPVVKELVAAGASFVVRDNNYYGTPLDHADHSARFYPTPGRSETFAYLCAHTTNPFDVFNHARDRQLADPAAVRVVATLQLLERAYAAFNARDLEGALALMHADVDWPNAFEGGRVQGTAAVRAYWTRQWQNIDPRVDPQHYREDGLRIVVEVHQVVRDRGGAVLVDQQVQHAYTIEDGLIRRMEIA
jgi:hypothetical protein